MPIHLGVNDIVQKNEVISVLLQTGICGSIAAETKDEHNPLITLRKEKVEKMLLALNQKPMLKRSLLTEYNSLSADIAKLLALNVLREEDNRIYVNFTLFSRKDKEIVTAVSDRYARGLAKTIANIKNKIFDVLERYPNQNVSVEKLAFMIVGCYFLDWGALRLLREWGVIVSKDQPGGNRYTLWAEEKVEGSLKAVYWGGHSLQAGDYLWHSFGDHHSPRYSFPDILYRNPDHRFDGSDAYKRLLFQKRIELAEELAQLLDTIGKAGCSVKRLQEQLGWGSYKLEQSLAMLEQMSYIANNDGQLSLLIPYFTAEDVKMMTEAVLLLLPVLRQWVDENISAIEADLGSTNPIKNKVPFNEVFIQVWHYIFGLTNKYLAEEGLIYDTYAAGFKHPGHMPALIKGRILEQMVGDLGE